jgi:hypothetical protein
MQTLKARENDHKVRDMEILGGGGPRGAIIEDPWKVHRSIPQSIIHPEGEDNFFLFKMVRR